MMFIEVQSAYFILRKWKQVPMATRREIGVFAHWMEDDRENDLPLSAEYIHRVKQFLKRYAPTSYYNLFPEERGGEHCE